VEKWESGVKKPSGMAVKLLTIVQKHGLRMWPETDAGRLGSLIPVSKTRPGAPGPDAYE